jgi:hypothetical protein
VDYRNYSILNPENCKEEHDEGPKEEMDEVLGKTLRLV